MLAIDNFSKQPFQSEKIDNLFDFLNQTTRETDHYSSRNKQVVNFHSLHHFANGVLTTHIYSPTWEDITIQLKADKNGYLIKMSVGELNDDTVKIMSKSLQGLRTRVKGKVDTKNKKKPALTGFNYENLDGIYLWGSNPGKRELAIFQEAVDIGQMSDRFRTLCIQHNISVEKFPRPGIKKKSK